MYLGFSNEKLDAANRRHKYEYPLLLHNFFTSRCQGLDDIYSGVQCFPYQAVTGKIYRPKQHIILPATALRFTKIKEVLSTHQVATNLAAKASKILKLAT